MKTKLGTWIALAVMGAATCGSAPAQDKKRVPDDPKAAPSLPKTYSKEKSTGGLLARAAQVVVVSDRGAFGLSAQSETGAVFEWGEKGYDTRLRHLGSQGGFLYFEVTQWQVIVAIRDTSPFDIWFFLNGQSDPVRFASASRPFPAAP